MLRDSTADSEPVAPGCNPEQLAEAPSTGDTHVLPRREALWGWFVL